MLNNARWLTRLALWGSAAAAGACVVLFAKLADIALEAFVLLVSGRPWLPFLLAPAVGMSTVWATQRWFPGTQGSGIPQVIAAIRKADAGTTINGLISLKIAAGKILLGSFALLGGFSAGREGPSVQVAASIVAATHSRLPHRKALRLSDLVLAGGAAGIAAAFNTPLAGIVFAVEELGRRLESRTSGVLISTIIVAGLTSISVMGNYNYFGQLRVFEPDRSFFVPVVAGGIICGFSGGMFSRIVLLPEFFSDFFLWRWRRAHPIWFAGACGLVVAAIGVASNGESFGSGYAITRAAVDGTTELTIFTALARAAATIATYFSGIPGGIFAPTLAVGGALGSSLAPYVGYAGDPIPIMALFMAGFLAAVTQAPITSAIIVMEMIDGHQMVISLISVAFIAKVLSAQISPPLYQQLAMRWR